MIQTETCDNDIYCTVIGGSSGDVIRTIQTIIKYLKETFVKIPLMKTVLMLFQFLVVVVTFCSREVSPGKLKGLNEMCNSHS